jgi:hypothetical protein
VAGDLPRFFVPHGEPRPAEAGTPRHLLDVVRVSEEEARLVLCDGAGALSLVPSARRRELPAEIQAALAAHELVRPPRLVRAEELWLMAVGRLERLPDVAGANDPVYLEGKLLGPLPSDAPGVVSGRLAVTRGDALDALVRGARDLVHAPVAGGGRWFHMLLPGGDEDDARAGRGLVLAYPLSQPDLELMTAGNELHTATLLHDVLEALHADPVFREAAGSGLAPLPVPGRAPLEASLRARGFEVEGDVAVRRGSGFLGGLRKERVQLPAEGTVEDFLRLASAALRAIAGWPTPRSLALRGRMPTAVASWVNGEDRGLRVLGGADLFRDELSLALAPNIVRQVGLAIDDGYTPRGPSELELDHMGGSGELQVTVVYPSERGQERAAVRVTCKPGYTVTVVPMPEHRLEPSRPEAGRVALELEGEGTVWIRRLTVRPRPARASSPPPAAPRGRRRGRRDR